MSCSSLVDLALDVAIKKPFKENRKTFYRIQFHDGLNTIKFGFTSYIIKAEGVP